jgi:hypothetical protein
MASWFATWSIFIPFAEDLIDIEAEKFHVIIAVKLRMLCLATVWWNLVYAQYAAKDFRYAV